ncbi:hypothetical protein A4V15_01270 [Pseudomonas oryzihabitans]|uniref:Uncharacterized protein n=1 Tax=Pseudomonas oryzihabitans TaxID=47885 RepID=A0A178LPL7_9PSED|nr:hypothetical protein A4V15_01270 [Pseudomonas oryzihabitans]
MSIQIARVVLTISLLQDHACFASDALAPLAVEEAGQMLEGCAGLWTKTLCQGQAIQQARQVSP